MRFKADECQICKGPIDSDSREETRMDFSNLPYALQPDSKRCCSYTCLHSAVMCNGAWQLKENLRRVMNTDFGTFQSIFAFGEEGGYAKGMFELARTHSLSFLLRLDTDNFMKLVMARL